MSPALQDLWTGEQFLDWADAQGEPSKFDGIRPVAMTGGNIRHDTIAGNLTPALRPRLDGSRCSSHRPNVGIRTILGRIRYPDGLITCAKVQDDERIAPDPCVVFEVVSPGAVRTDEVLKVREYQVVPSILRDIIVESSSPTVLCLHRISGAALWTLTPLDTADSLTLPELD